MVKLGRFGAHKEGLLEVLDKLREANRARDQSFGKRPYGPILETDSLGSNLGVSHFSELLAMGPWIRSHASLSCLSVGTPGITVKTPPCRLKELIEDSPLERCPVPSWSSHVKSHSFALTQALACTGPHAGRQ